jgi:hypothetical protein
MAPRRNTLSGNVRITSVELLNDPRAIEPRVLEQWRGHALGSLRIGLARVIDATFKRLPAFQRRFVTYLTGALDGQPAILLALVICSTAAGFGGPYKAGSTDIGTAVYFFVFVALFPAQSGLSLGLDRCLMPTLGRWGRLASGPLENAMPLCA